MRNVARYDGGMNGSRNQPHSYYPTDVFMEEGERAARARDAEWEANDPNMQALTALGHVVKDEGEAFSDGWVSPK